MIDGFHTPEFRFLSNFYLLRAPYLIRLRNPISEIMDVCPSVEHAYQAAKFIENRFRKEILRCANPAKTKVKARELKEAGFLRPDWEVIQLPLMKALLVQKIKDPLILKELLATGDELIQESNWWGDSWWGVVTSIKGKPCIPYGENRLGKLWMEIREDVYSAIATERRPDHVPIEPGRGASGRL